MKSRFSQRDKELMRRAQLGICPGCLKPLGDNSQGHDPFAGNHNSFLAGVMVHNECHKGTPSYGTGKRGLLNFFFKP